MIVDCELSQEEMEYVKAKKRKSEEMKISIERVYRNEEGLILQFGSVVLGESNDN